MNNPAEEIINIMREKKLTLGTVESATGGLIAHLITNVPGSSDVFQGSIISYSNEIKMKIVGVKESTLKEYGAVSAQVADGNGKRRQKSVRRGYLRGGYRHCRTGRRHPRKTRGTILSWLIA